MYDRALPQVYGYLRPRCQNEQEAEDLTADVFLAAVRSPPPQLTVAWLVTVARHKLVDQWRRGERDQRRLAALESAETEAEDAWDATLDAFQARTVLAGMSGQHRAALSLRYLDGLAVSEVAELLGRTVHATEALLVRARVAFRRAYEKGDQDV